MGRILIRKSTNRNNLLKRYVEYDRNYETYKGAINSIEKLIAIFPKEVVIPKVYERYQSHSIHIKTLIENCKLFSASKILELCDKDVHRTIDLLDAKTDYSKSDDLELMQKIINKLSSRPDTGKIKIVKGGQLSKEQEKFIYQNGHKNSLDSEYCENYNCGINMKGLTRDETEHINMLKQRIDVLKSIMQA